MITSLRLRRAGAELLNQRQRPVRPHNFEEQIYHALIRRGDFVIDVGANDGGVSRFMSRLIGPEGKIVAFEPVWPTYVKLCRNTQDYTYDKCPILTVPCGLAETEKTARVQVPDNQFSLASLASAENWKRAQGSSGLVSYDCSFVALDEFLAAKQLGAPDFIKIDVEGAEIFALQGARKLLYGDARPPMLIEIFAPWERAFGYSPWDVLSFLMSAGYEFLFACPEGLVEHNPSPRQPFPTAYVNGSNLVALTKEHRERAKALDPLRSGGGSEILPMSPPPEPNRVA